MFTTANMSKCGTTGAGLKAKNTRRIKHFTDLVLPLQQKKTTELGIINQHYLRHLPLGEILLIDNEGIPYPFRILNDTHRQVFSQV